MKAAALEAEVSASEKFSDSPNPHLITVVPEASFLNFRLD